MRRFMWAHLLATKTESRLETLERSYRLKQSGRIWYDRLKDDMEEIGYTQCPDYAIFRIGTWKRGDWAVCAFWVDNETGIGARCQLNRVVDMLRKKYGISGEGELRWTLEIGVKRDFDTHIISFSQEAYINKFIERSGLHGARPVTTPLAPRRNPHQRLAPQDA